MRAVLSAAAAAGLFSAALISEFAAAQVPSCRYFKVQTPSLNISKEPRGDSPFIDVLDKDDTVCVTKDQKAGGREWAYIAQRVLKADNRQPVDGWANLKQLQPLSPAESAALDKPAAASVPTAEAKSDGTLRFNEPISFGPFPVNGKTIEQLASDVPMFPPIEGLDEAVWKKPCAACHLWDRRQLCEQGASYAKNPKSALRHPHPYGGAYKVALMQWAKSGCQ